MTRAKAPPGGKTNGAAADEILATITHPLKADIAAVRTAILSVDKAIVDGAKWNSLSFRTTEWFATWNWRAQDQVQLVLHLGAKTGKELPDGAIPDPARLLEWKGKDRALASLGSGAELKARLPALKALLKAWIRYV